MDREIPSLFSCFLFRKRELTIQNQSNGNPNHSSTQSSQTLFRMCTCGDDSLDEVKAPEYGRIFQEIGLKLDTTEAQMFQEIGDIVPVFNNEVCDCLAINNLFRKEIIYCEVHNPGVKKIKDYGYKALLILKNNISFVGDFVHVIDEIYDEYDGIKLVKIHTADDGDDYWVSGEFDPLELMVRLENAQKFGQTRYFKIGSERESISHPAREYKLEFIVDPNPRCLSCLTHVVTSLLKVRGFVNLRVDLTSGLVKLNATAKIRVDPLVFANEIKLQHGSGH